MGKEGAPAEGSLKVAKGNSPNLLPQRRLRDESRHSPTLASQRQETRAVPPKLLSRERILRMEQLLFKYAESPVHSRDSPVSSVLALKKRRHC